MMIVARLFASLVSGALLANAYGLEPFWPLAWIAPIPLLAACIGASRLGALGYGALAGAVSMAGIGPFLFGLAGPIPTLIFTLIKALLWALIALAVRSSANRLPAWAVVFTFPALMALIETVLAVSTPNGTAGALAYSQMNFLPAIQVASLGGAPAITFVVTLFASAAAFVIARRALAAAIAPALIVVAALGFGFVRSGGEPTDGEGLQIALIADDSMAGVPEDWRAALGAYTPRIEALARDGARFIVLPEKIAHVGEADRAELEALLSGLAARTNASLVVGLDVEAEGRRLNRAYLAAPNGALQSYDKIHMIPGFESHFAIGAGPLVTESAFGALGVAICKDMDFPDLGRTYAGVSVLAVPAWDFTADAWLHSRMGILRGVESGYAILRAAREGALTVSDHTGRVLAEAPSGEGVLIARAPPDGSAPTLYARIGDVFGWGCGLLAVLLIGAGFVSRRAGQGGANAD